MDSKNFVKQPLVFTLGDDEPVREAWPEQISAAAEPVREETAAMLAGWEQKLEQLRQNKVRRPEPPLQVEDVFNSDAVWPAVAGRGERSAVKAVDWEEWTAEVEARAAEVRPSPLKSAPPTTADAVALPDPVQRERAYRAYLQQWQHQHALEQAQQQSLLNDTAVLIQEDWLAAQECLQMADPEAAAACVVRLGADAATDAVLSEAPPVSAGHPAPGEDAPTETGADVPAAPVAEAVTHVHLHVLPPQGMQGRRVCAISEAELLQRLQDKLRPHLADALSGLVRVAVQKQTAQLVSQLQQQMLAEVPDLVDEVLQHNLQQVMQQVKTQLQNR